MRTRALLCAVLLQSCAVVMIGPKGDVHRCVPGDGESVDSCVGQMERFGYVRLENYNPRLGKTKPVITITEADIAEASGPNCSRTDVTERLNGGMSKSAVRSACN